VGTLKCSAGLCPGLWGLPAFFAGRARHLSKSAALEQRNPKAPPLRASDFTDMDGKPVTLTDGAFRVYRVRRRTHPATKYAPRAEAPGNGQRVGLARAISKMGHCSRAQAAELIAAGRVRLNGAVRRNAEAPVLLGQDKIEVDGREIRAAEKAYWVLNKPRGVVTTTSDEKGRATVYDCMGESGSWLAPVGRLDKASEGLLLLTNDSEWAARVLDPAGHVAKTYHVQIAALADETLLEALRRGVREGSDLLRVESLRELRSGERNSWLEIVLHEGKNRQIRRMLEANGVEVLRLVRVAIGGLKLGELGKGESRKLSAAEKAAVESWRRTR
jgi:23S rRNA pseudouridine2605 synthase